MPPAPPGLQGPPASLRQFWGFRALDLGPHAGTELSCSYREGAGGPPALSGGSDACEKQQKRRTVRCGQSTPEWMPDRQEAAAPRKPPRQPHTCPRLPACLPACRRDHQELKVVACGSLNRKEGEGWWNLPSSLYRPSPERLSDLPRSHSKFMESLVSLTGGNPRFTPFHQLCIPGTGRNWWNTGRAVTAFPLKGRGPLSPADKIRDSGSSCRGSVG